MKTGLDNFHKAPLLSGGTHYYMMCIWIFLAVLCGYSVSLAQQPTAAVSALSGEVFVSIQGLTDIPATPYTILSQGDAIQTHTGATAALIFSDGSTLVLGENTTIELAVFDQEPATGARMSHIYLLWGSIRAILSSGHQKPGSSFKVETLNALVNVTFSQPDLEVFYNPHTETTTAFAHTVALLLTNLLTGESALILERHTGIIQGQSIEDRQHVIQPSKEPILSSVETLQPPANRPISQLIQLFKETRQARTQPSRSKPRTLSSSPELPASQSKPVQPLADTTQIPTGVPEGVSLGSGKIAVIGAGAVAAAGGVALIASSGSKSASTPPLFTGTFEKDLFIPSLATGSSIITFTLTQDGTSITGERVHTLTINACGSTRYTVTVTGTVQQKSGALSYPAHRDAANMLICGNGRFSIFTEGGPCNVELVDEDSILRLSGCSGLSADDGDYIRQ